ARAALPDSRRDRRSGQARAVRAPRGRSGQLHQAGRWGARCARSVPAASSARAGRSSWSSPSVVVVCDAGLADRRPTRATIASWPSERTGYVPLEPVLSAGLTSGVAGWNAARLARSWTLPRDVARWHWPVYGDGPTGDMPGSIAVMTPADPAQDRTPLPL